MSIVKWNGRNLLKSIAENEKEATKLYRMFASEARIGEKFFELLAQDEERHEKIYNALLEKYSDKLELEMEESDAEYMDLLIESNIGVDDELVEKAKKIFTKSQIFDLAERAEDVYKRQAVETVNPKMPETVDADILKKMNQSGEIKDCLVEGPISVDLTFNRESAEIKGFKSPVTGEADILLVPSITCLLYTSRCV